jgi:hypothetical protein
LLPLKNTVSPCRNRTVIEGISLKEEIIKSGCELPVLFLFKKRDSLPN